jgi:hypothetical protein
MLTLADLYDEAFIGARASILIVLLLLQGTPVENNSEGEGEGKGDDAEEEDNEVTEFWLELAWIQLFVLGLTVFDLAFSSSNASCLCCFAFPANRRRFACVRTGLLMELL